MPAKRQKLAALLWLASMLLLGLAAWQSWQNSPPLEISVLNLLPKSQHNPLQEHALQQLSYRGARQVMFLIGHDQPQHTRQAAEQFYQQLNNPSLFDQIQFRADDQQHPWQAFFFDYRYQLLDHDSRQLLQTQPQQLTQQALQALYSPVNQPRFGTLDQDPLGLFSHWLQSRPLPSNISLENGLLMLRSNEKSYVIISATLAENAFSLSYQQRVMPHIEQARQQLTKVFPEIEILSSGLLMHAAANAEQAQQEISTIGIGSLLGIILLLLSTFRSLRPLLLALIPIAAGVLAATVCCIWIFGKVHVLTLVFGASLVGVSIDYSLHYLCSRFEQGVKWNPQIGLQLILPGITLGLISSTLAYGAIAWGPFPGLQQMALFSVVGLIAAWATVICLFPLFSGGLTTQPPWLYSLYANNSHALIGRRAGIPLLLVAGLLIGASLTQLQSNDDIRLLQSSPQQILDQDRRVQQLTDTPLSHQFLLIEADNSQQLLEKEQQLGEQLRLLTQQGVLTQYQALSQFVPSIQQQQLNHQLQASLYTTEGEVQQLFSQIGATGLAEQSQQRFLASSEKQLSLEQWLANPASKPYSHLWLGEFDGHVASLITFSGVKGVERLQQLATLHDPANGIYFVDSVTDISQVMSHYRQQISWLVAGAYLLVILLLALRYQWQVWRVIVAPLLAGLLTLAILTLLGKSISVFNILAQLLVLGIGMDFGIFLRESRNSAAARLAITLSALTTTLSFGLLAFSETMVLHTFGLTLVIGISLSWLIAILVASADASQTTIRKDGVTDEHPLTP